MAETWLRRDWIAPGMALIEQGGMTGSLYVLKDGELEVVRDGKYVTTIKTPGAVIGEMSVLLNTPQTATVRAVSEVDYFVIDDAIEVLRTHSPQSIASLMAVSDKLAALNVARYQAWRPRFTATNSRQAVLAFNGDVYDGLQARSLSAKDFAWAQDHVAILSGLYGVLRPLDRMQPYRLEMGTRLATGAGSNLYDYWGSQIAEHLNTRLRADKKPIPGFGHPQHANGDPRANLLLQLARERGVGGAHVAMLYAIRDALPGAIGRTLPINVNGPIPAILLDLGWPVTALKGIGLLCRTAGLIGHLTEEAERPIGFILSGAAAAAIEYDGPR